MLEHAVPANILVEKEGIKWFKVFKGKEVPGEVLLVGKVGNYGIAVNNQNRVASMILVVVVVAHTGRQSASDSSSTCNNV